MGNILICDDAAFMRMTLAKLVEENGHAVAGQAANGKEALERYKELNPDLVLMDITMPDVDGIEATKSITSFDSNAKIVMVSAMGQMEKVCQAIDAGAKDFVVKPFNPDKIVECLNKYIQ